MQSTTVSTILQQYTTVNFLRIKIQRSDLIIRNLLTKAHRKHLQEELFPSLTGNTIINEEPTFYREQHLNWRNNLISSFIYRPPQWDKNWWALANVLVCFNEASCQIIKKVEIKDGSETVTLLIWYYMRMYRNMYFYIKFFRRQWCDCHMLEVTYIHSIANNINLL